MKSLIDYHLRRPDRQLPPVNEAGLLDYVLGENGVFARGRRPGLEVCMPISFSLAPVRGLGRTEPYVQWGWPKVPELAVKDALRWFQAEAANGLEALIYLTFHTCDEPCAAFVNCNAGWHVVVPDQDAGADYVRPRQTGAGSSTERAIIEVHSHHAMRPDFSPTDNQDESGGFRIYSVIGNLPERPTIRSRVGLWGNFWECRSNEFFEMPEGLEDAVI